MMIKNRTTHHHCANLSENIELIKCLSDIFCRVCEWDKACSLSYPLYNIWGCVFAVCPFPLWWLRGYMLCLIIIIKSEVWTITYCLGLGHETMVCAICLSIFLWICDMAGLLRGTFVSWWYLPRIWPSVTDMQHYYHARYPTDDWHLAYMFSLVYFSVEVYLVGVFPHSVSTWRDPRVRFYVPLTLLPLLTRKQNRRGDPALYLSQARGHLNWRMGLPALLGGKLGCWIFQFPLIVHSLWGVS